MPKSPRVSPLTNRPLRKGGLLAAAFVGLAGLSGCAADSRGVVYNKNFTAGYSPTSLSALRQPLLVETFGLPGAGQTQQAVTEATVNGLRDNGPRWAQLGYSGNPVDAPNPPYKLRFAYGAPVTFARADLCGEGLQASDVGGDGSSGRTVAALCRGTRFVAIAEGSPGVDADIASADFSNFVGLIGRQVLPRRNPVVDDDCLLRVCD